jgi:tetratricopeptide (TPR) repeat protein
MEKERRVKKQVFRIAFLCILMLVVACSKRKENSSSPVAPRPPSTEQRVEEGWRSFESGSYADAAKEFNAILESDPDHAAAMVGYGWSMLYRGKLAVADSILAEARKLEPDEDYADILAGMTIATSALDSHCLAAETGLELIQHEESYVFAYDSTIDAEAVARQTAVGAYLCGDSVALVTAASLLVSRLPEPDDSSSWRVDSVNAGIYLDAVFFSIDY